MICDFADVVVVPFPFVERPVTKWRPAAVLSNAGFNGDNGQTVLAMITTARPTQWPSDLSIGDGSGAGLLHASVIRWKVFTLPNELIQRRLGALAGNDRARMMQALERYFAPAPVT